MLARPRQPLRIAVVLAGAVLAAGCSSRPSAGQRPTVLPNGRRGAWPRSRRSPVPARSSWAPASATSCRWRPGRSSPAPLPQVPMAHSIGSAAGTSGVPPRPSLRRGAAGASEGMPYGARGISRRGWWRRAPCRCARRGRRAARGRPGAGIRARRASAALAQPGWFGGTGGGPGWRAWRRDDLVTRP